MSFTAACHVLQQHDGKNSLADISALVSSFLGPSPNLSLARACEFGSTKLLNLVWNASCTVKRNRTPNWSLRNYLRSDVHYSRWGFSKALAVAAKSGNIEVLQWLLEQFPGCEIEDEVVKGAAAAGHLLVLQLLQGYADSVGKEAHISTIDGDSLTLASINGHSEVVQWLVDRVIPIDDEIANTLAADAARHGNIALLEWLEARGFNYDASSVLRLAPGKVLEWIVARRGHNNFFSRSSRQEVRSFLYEAVQAAARVGRVDMLEILVILAETCCEGDAFLYSSALEQACRHGQLAVVEWTHSIEQSHQGDHRYKVYGVSSGVLDDVASNGHLQLAKLLCSRYKAQVSDLAVTMLLAAANRHLDVVEWLYNKFATQTGIRMFQSRQNEVDLDLAHNVDPVMNVGPLWDVDAGNRMANHVGTQAMTANVTNNPLLTLSDVTSIRPATAMDAAAMFGHLDVLRFLRNARSNRAPHLDLTLPRDLPMTTHNAMDGATAFGHLEVVKWLHENEHARCSDHALAEAARNRHVDVVEWLFDNRACDFSSIYILPALAVCTAGRAMEWVEEHPMERPAKVVGVTSVAGNLQMMQLLHDNMS